MTTTHTNTESTGKEHKGACDNNPHGANSTRGTKRRGVRWTQRGSAGLIPASSWRGAMPRGKCWACEPPGYLFSEITPVAVACVGGAQFLSIAARKSSAAARAPCGRAAPPARGRSTHLPLPPDWGAAAAPALAGDRRALARCLHDRAPSCRASPVAAVAAAAVTACCGAPPADARGGGCRPRPAQPLAATVIHAGRVRARPRPRPSPKPMLKPSPATLRASCGRSRRRALGPRPAPPPAAGAPAPPWPRPPPGARGGLRRLFLAARRGGDESRSSSQAVAPSWRQAPRPAAGARPAEAAAAGAASCAMARSLHELAVVRGWRGALAGPGALALRLALAAGARRRFASPAFSSSRREATEVPASRR